MLSAPWGGPAALILFWDGECFDFLVSSKGWQFLLGTHTYLCPQTGRHTGFQVACVGPTWSSLIKIILGEICCWGWSLVKAAMDVCHKYTLAHHVADSVSGTRSPSENPNPLAQMLPFIPWGWRHILLQQSQSECGITHMMNTPEAGRMSVNKILAVQSWGPTFNT